MNKLHNVLGIILILLILALPVLAQDTPPSDGTVSELDSVTLPEWAQELTYGSLLVTALIGLGKYVPFLSKFTTNQQKLVLVVLLLIAHLYVKETGDLGAFSAKITSLGELATRGLAFIGLFVGSSAIHEASGKVPLLGNSRSS